MQEQAQFRSAQPTDVRTVHQELSKLWDNVSLENNTRVESAMRVCTLNLIVCTPSADVADHMSGTIQHVMTCHPNRSIVIVNHPKSEESKVDMWVQAHCQLPMPGKPQVCGEQISIEAHGSAFNQAAGILLSLLLPDLPVILWWPGKAPFDSPLLSRLYHMIDRVIVDSATFTDPDYDLTRMAKLHGKEVVGGDVSIASYPGYVISDMNWLRLNPWREIVAQFFDTPTTQRYVHNLDRVEICYTNDPNTPTNRIQALLFVGWLATRLRWRPLDDTVSIESDMIRFNLRRSAPSDKPKAVRFTAVELHEIESDEPLPRISAVRMYSTIDMEGSFTAEQTDNPSVVKMVAHMSECHDGEPYEWLTEIEHEPEEKILSDELRIVSYDRVFTETLHMAGILGRYLIS